MQLIFFVFAGGFSIICAVGDYNWFMEHYKARFMVGLLGRNGARVFYGLLGLFVIIIGIALHFFK
jgi:hypothetical protein